VSDVPVGTFLSGGIDSPLVSAKAKAAHNGPVRSFTIGTNGDELDESRDAEAYAREIGVDHIVEHLAPESAIELLDDVAASCAEPFADYSIFPTMLIARLARRHVKVVLSGDGGDELFWGYPTRFVPPLMYGAEFRQPQWLRNLRWGAARILARGRRTDLRHRSIGAYYRASHSRIDEQALRDLFPEVPAWPASFSMFEYDGCDPDVTAQWLRWNEFVGHLTMVLLKVDRASMHHSLEVRVPLLDREVIEVASRVDWRSCLDPIDALGKIPLRKALARHVRHQTHAKRGFEAPMHVWLQGPLTDTFREEVINRKALLGLELNRRNLETMLRDHNSGARNHTRKLWTLLSLALWEKRHYRRRTHVCLRHAASNRASAPAV
jgi:asparagine synthase (glutamine-hydrolysing)